MPSPLVADPAPEPGVAHVGAPFTSDLFVTYSHGVDGAGNGFLALWQSRRGQTSASPATA